MRRHFASLALIGGLWMAEPGLAAVWQDMLRDGFEGTDFAPEGGLYYRENYEQSAGRAEFQSKVVRTGNGALRLSVRPLCPPAGHDCSERAEVWERTKFWVPYDQGIWHRFAVQFEEPVPVDANRYVIAQWKRQILPGAVGDYSPFLAIRMYRGKLFATVETDLVKTTSCAPGHTPVWQRPDTSQTRALVATDQSFDAGDGPLFTACTEEIVVTDRGNKLPAPNSGWIDFAVYTKPGPDGSGHVEIFANDKWIVSVKGKVGHADDKGLGDRQYFKFGPYRGGGEGEWALYYDDFRRSPDCRDVMANGACPF
jgi:Polysaccharide lyase